MPPGRNFIRLAGFVTAEIAVCGKKRLELSTPSAISAVNTG
jgi:hypothetical protein